MAAILPANAQTMWDALIAQGASGVQAAAIVANSIAESGITPDESAMDSNGAFSRGLMMWNDLGAGAGVNWSQYMTGNTAADISSQVGLIKAQGGFAKAWGADAATAAEHFANLFEACAECAAYPGQPGFAGMSQTLSRGQEATVVYQVAQTGNWGLGSTLPPVSGPGLVPSDPQGSAAPATAVTAGWQLPITPGGIGSDVQQIWADMGGPIAGTEKMYQAISRLVPFLIAPSTWIRAGEVVLGVILGSAGLALVAVILAGEHPNLVADLAALVPGEGEVAVGARGAAQAARSGSAARTVLGGARAAQGASRARRAAPRPVRTDVAGAGRTSRQAASAAAGTARRATGGLTPTQRAYTSAARSRERNQRLARQWGEPAGSPADPDDQRYEAAKAAGRSNRAYHRREMAPRRRDRSDLRRRTP